MGYCPEDVATMRNTLAANTSSPMNYHPQPAPYVPVQPATRVAGTAKPRSAVIPNVEAPARWSGDTYTEQWQSTLENTAADHRRFLEECATFERDLMPEAYQDLRHSFRDTESARLASTAADAYQGRTELAHQRVQAVIDGIAAQADAPDSGSRSIRVRDRLQRAVDKAAPGEVAAVVAKAVADAPGPDLPAIVAEAPAMLQTAGVDGEFLRQVLAQRIPALADAMCEEKKSEQSRQCIAQNKKRLDECIRTAAPLRVPLVNPVALGLDPDASHA
jgi:hypothetical protein